MSKRTINMYMGGAVPTVSAHEMYKGYKRIDYVPRGRNQTLALVFSKEDMATFKLALTNSTEPILKSILDVMNFQERYLDTKDTECIPTGTYCHGKRGEQLCPYWAVAEDMPHQMDGYCDYLEKGDWELSAGHSLLWDQCKSCGINEEDY